MFSCTTQASVSRRASSKPPRGIRKGSASMRNGTSAVQLEAQSALSTGVGEDAAVVLDHAELRIAEESFLPVLSIRRSRITMPDIAPLLQRAGLAVPEAP